MSRAVRPSIARSYTSISRFTFERQRLRTLALDGRHPKDAVISIMATIAKQENIRRSERIRAGSARTKARGTRLGRPRVKDSKASRVTLWRRAKEV